MTKPFYENPNYLAVVGSRLYGYANPDSDTDMCGWVIPPTEYLIGIKNFTSYKSPAEDSTIYSLREYLNLLCKGSTAALESLLSTQIVSSDKIADELRSMSNLFVSQRYYYAMRGFAFAEYKKALCISIETQWKEDHRSLLDKVITSFELDKVEQGELLHLIEDKIKPEKITTNNLDVGQRRKEEFEKFGYCPKNAAHSIRLLFQCWELLDTGKINFPLSMASVLKMIRKGTEYTPKNYTELYKTLHAKVEDRFKVTTLPKVPDVDKINSWYQQMVLDYIR